MKPDARGPYQVNAFLSEPCELYGTIAGSGTLVGPLKLVMWDGTGAQVLNSDASVTDGAARTYSAPFATYSLAAGYYTWEVRQIIDSNQYAVCVWGYLTLTGAPPDDI